MEFFAQAKTVRLKSHHDKYLVAEDAEHVTQDRDGTGRDARWSVERVEDAPNIIRLRSWQGRYLTATDEPCLVTGKKVRLTLPLRLDSSVEWEPLREGALVKFKTRYGNYLRANGGLPPLRNSVTHNIPHRSSTQDWILWNVEVVEVIPQLPPDMDFSSSRLSKADSSSTSASLHMVEGRSIYYAIGDDDGNVDDTVEWSQLIFNGTCVEELTQMLKEETKIDDIVACTRNPLTHKLIPLHLHLPPNNATMRLIIVEANSKVAKSFNI
ncbi:hypothetical protein Cni_G13719 [Canna indica]|uniref:DUF569 domain-containing protein n=1 Tax=Canna indica TaxID=4628 RepID=A0AAQ3QCY6_9LILI|nr:hypothetical protein Cni_G13719 [Canna indica]